MSDSSAAALEALYNNFNKRHYVHPDPLECVYPYRWTGDREIAAFLSAALAYGNVRQILKSVSDALGRMGGAPADYLRTGCLRDFERDFEGFVHRFATGTQMAALLTGLKCIIEDYGSLGDAFASGTGKYDATCLPGLSAFVSRLLGYAPCSPGHLVAVPEKGSACKRLNLFLRWMVRRDDVDPGGWDMVPTSRLIVPLDTHMFRACCGLRFSKRKQPDMKTALEVTAGFARFVPEDPVRYDFVLTRPGIRGPW